MRLAIGRISDGELDFAKKICMFVREIYRELTLIAPKMSESSDMRTKMDTMLQSVMKVENGIILTTLSRYIWLLCLVITTKIHTLVPTAESIQLNKIVIQMKCFTNHSSLLCVARSQ